jgi:hypothetical protein
MSSASAMRASHRFRTRRAAPAPEYGRHHRPCVRGSSRSISSSASTRRGRLKSQAQDTKNVVVECQTYRVWFPMDGHKVLPSTRSRCISGATTTGGSIKRCTGAHPGGAGESGAFTRETSDTRARRLGRHDRLLSAHVVDRLAGRPVKTRREPMRYFAFHVDIGSPVPANVRKVP